MTTDVKLLRSKKKFQILFENSPIGMAMVIHATGEFVEVNPSLLKSTGYTREEFLNLSYWDITPREYEKQEMDQIEELNKTGKFGPNFKEYIRKDGTRYPIKISGFKLTDVDGTEVVWGLIEDISERVKMEDELRDLASHDFLTGLTNRRSLEEKLELVVSLSKRNNKRFAYITFDLDKFKAINDNFGHLIGDRVLQEMALKLRRIAKRSSDIIARTGGDEFTVVLTDIDDLGHNFLDRIVDIINEPFELDGVKHEVTASIGVALFPDDGDSYESLYKESDKRTYCAKRQGGNRYIL